MLFIDNKYTKFYFHIITNFKSEIGEIHHIIPKSLGGSNEDINLVRVSPKAHFILHKLLIRMVKHDSHKAAMNYALFMMMNRNICNYTSRTYNNARYAVSEQMKLNNPMHNPIVLNKRIGQKRTEETKNKMVEAQINRWKKTSRPIREFNCPICNNYIKTRIPTQKTCSTSCSSILQHKK